MSGRLIGAGLLLLVVAGPAAGQHRSSAIRTATVQFDLGLLSARGNANASMFSFGERVYLKRVDDKIRFSQAFRAVRSQAEGVEGVDSYGAHVRFDYRVVRNLYLFGLGGWERDLQAGLRHRLHGLVGASFEWDIAQADILNFEAGVATFRQTDVRDDPDGLDGTTTAGHIGARFKHIFSKDTYFAQSVELIPNFSVGGAFRTVTESEASARVSGIVSMKLNYLIRYSQRPSLDPGSTTGARLAKTDKILTAGLSFSF